LESQQKEETKEKVLSVTGKAKDVTGSKRISDLLKKLTRGRGLWPAIITLTFLGFAA